jgi:hypothetical protein
MKANGSAGRHSFPSTKKPLLFFRLKASQQSFCEGAESDKTK